MTGLLLFAIVGIWLFVAIRLTRWVCDGIRPTRLKLLTSGAIFTLLLFLPVADEIVGGFQLRALCAAGAVVKVGVSDPAGRTARYYGDPIDEKLPGTAIPIFFSHIEYKDVVTNEIVASYERYVAKSGILIRILGMSEGNSPLTIGSPSCSGERGASLPIFLNFNVVN